LNVNQDYLDANIFLNTPQQHQIQSPVSTIINVTSPMSVPNTSHKASGIINTISPQLTSPSKPIITQPDSPEQNLTNILNCNNNNNGTVTVITSDLINQPSPVENK
jgi:hypothetical protein